MRKKWSLTIIKFFTQTCDWLTLCWKVLAQRDSRLVLTSYSIHSRAHKIRRTTSLQNNKKNRCNTSVSLGVSLSRLLYTFCSHINESITKLQNPWACIWVNVQKDCKVITVSKIRQNICSTCTKSPRKIEIENFPQSISCMNSLKLKRVVSCPLCYCHNRYPDNISISNLFFTIQQARIKRMVKNSFW